MNGRLITGAVMVLFVLVINATVALIGTDATNASAPAGCTTSDNNVTCENVGKTTFLASFLATTATGIGGAPTVLNIVYLLIMDTILVVGILLVVLAFIPFTNQ